VIPVTKTFFPPIKDFEAQINRIWDNKWLTNNGELLQELSMNLKKYLGVTNFIPMTNGTLPIQIALKIVGGNSEIITTPFSYVATTSAIIWENCTPVFVDIDPNHLTIDETKIESAITSKTTAILATHVYGNPCNIDAIEGIAKKYSLKVIYDAAHCFGVEYKGNSIFNYGDISTCSFHATKIFHTGEGGALFCKDSDLNHRFYYSHNFGHNGQEQYHGLGINGKMSELQAAMGLSVLPHMNSIFNERKRICELYDTCLHFNYFRKISIRQDTIWNYSYYPIVFESEKLLLETCEKLKTKNIFPRRYFFPSLEELPYINKGRRCIIASDISKRVLCLPLYYGLSNDQVKMISNYINQI
jgi:dTDP-4-amino-4,6-dideoxygalactose transaminase